MVVYSVDHEEFKNIIQTAKSDIHIFVDFYADWCRPCKAISPKIDELSEKYDHVIFLKVNIDNQRKLATIYEINSVPTFLIFKGGKLDPEKSLIGANIDKINTLLESIDQ